MLDLARPLPESNSLNKSTTFGYDAKGNLTTITNALNKITTLTVNPQGQPLTIKDPLNNITTFTYELGDLIAVKDPLNRETKRMLDAAGRLRSLINPLGQKTIYTPDALDRITHLTDAINGVTQFGYDANSNLLTVTDAKSQQTVYTPNNMNRTTSRKGGRQASSRDDHVTYEPTFNQIATRQSAWPHALAPPFARCYSHESFNGRVRYCHDLFAFRRNVIGGRKAYVDTTQDYPTPSFAIR